MNALIVLLTMMLLGQNAPAKPNTPLGVSYTNQTGNIVMLHTPAELPHCAPAASYKTPCVQDAGVMTIGLGTGLIAAERSRAERLTDTEYSRLAAARKALQDVEQDIAKAHGVNFSTPCSDPSGIEMGFSCWSVSGVSPRDRYEFRGRWILINLEEK